MIKIHKEGFGTIVFGLALIALLIFISEFFFSEILVLNIFIYVLCAVFFTIILQFFRNPKRNTIQNNEHVISPCDGKVVTIEEVEEPEYFKDKRLLVSIFMSPFNVHVNRNPMSGTFKYVKYHSGKYLMAFHPKSSTENERSSIVIAEEKSGKEVLFRQIAGFLARRIVYYCKEGDKAIQGEEFGFIKFGSRVDLFFPLDTEITVKIGDKVKGAESVIAKL